ncbi:MAG: pepsin-like aspartyl protease [Myxococcota bacterium]
MRWLSWSVWFAVSAWLTGCGSASDCANSIPLEPFAEESSLSARPRVIARKLTRSTPAVYTLAMQVGDPAKPQRLPVVADTGSAALVLQGKDCEGCRAKSRYSPSQLATALPGATRMVYGSGRADTQPVRDRVAWPGTNAAFPMEFNVMTKSERLPSVLGLAYANLLTPTRGKKDPFLVIPAKAGIQAEMMDSTFGRRDPFARTFLGELFNHTHLPRRFALLLCGLCPGSRLIVGDETATGRIRAADIRQWTPVVRQTYYAVPAQSLWWTLGDKRGKLGEFPDARLSDGYHDVTIVDSGSTFLVLPRSMAGKLARLLRRSATENGMVLPENFWDIEPTNRAATARRQRLDLSKFPTLELVLAGGDSVGAAVAARELGDSDDNGTITLRIKPRHYLQEMKPGKRAFAVNAGTSLAILGLPLLESYLTVFDLQNHAVGFASNEGLCCPRGAQRL